MALSYAEGGQPPSRSAGRELGDSRGRCYSRIVPDLRERLPSSVTYRWHLDRCSRDEPWVVGAAVLTLFVEGSVNERRELQALAGPPMTAAEIDKAVLQHPLARFHKVPASALELVRVHK